LTLHKLSFLCILALELSVIDTSTIIIQEGDRLERREVHIHDDTISYFDLVKGRLSNFSLSFSTHFDESFPDSGFFEDEDLDDLAVGTEESVE
jgi:hypothetical protein